MVHPPDGSERLEPQRARALQIESGLYRRQGKAQTNFTRDTCRALQSDLAQQVLKDPYNFDFLTLAEDARERSPIRSRGASPEVSLDEVKRIVIRVNLAAAALWSVNRANCRTLAWSAWGIAH